MALEDANPIKGVSGPGKYAKRLDRIPANFYGDQSQIAQIASSAPLAKTQNVKGQSLSQIPQSQITPLFAPSQRPGEPVTSGVNIGSGPGSEALMMNQVQKSDSDIVAQYLPSLTALAAQPDSPDSFRAFVKYLQGSL